MASEHQILKIFLVGHAPERPPPPNPTARSRPDQFDVASAGLAGVTGVGIGYKVTGGKETDQLAVVICVKEKRPEQELASDAILPKAFEQQKTDVRQLSLVEPPGFWGAEEQPDVTEDVEEQQVFIYVLKRTVFLCN